MHLEFKIKFKESYDQNQRSKESSAKLKTKSKQLLKCFQEPFIVLFNSF